LLIGVGVAGALGMGKEFLLDYSPDIVDMAANNLGISLAICSALLWRSIRGRG